MKSKAATQTMEVTKAIARLNGQIEKAERLYTLDWTDTDRDQWVTTGRGLLVAVFGGDRMDILRDFDRNGSFSTSPSDSLTTLRAKANYQINGYVAVLKSAAEQLEWTLPADSQHFIPSGSQHDAYQQIRKIIQATKTEIFIVDNYVDETTWKLLSNVTPAAKIYVLTMKMQNDFTLEGKHFVSQHGNIVEVRKAKDIHDRFLLIDSKTVWHLGPSIKDAGTKIAFMSEIQSPTLVAAVVKEIMGTWNTAVPVPL
jgi:hypothetical protein